MTVDVSVVMPVGGVDQHLPLQLDALCGQRFSGTWELVISLNSTDRADRVNVEALLADRSTLCARIVDSSDVRSASHARNVGADEAEADLLAFCDGDDIAEESWLAAMVAALENAEAVGGHLGEERLAIEGQASWRPPATPGALPTFLGQPYLVTANMGLRRSAYELVGAFDTTLIRGEDIAFSWDLIDRGVELHYAPEAVIHYRHREGLLPMMKQHYLYGRGFSQILARRGVPGADQGSTGLRSLRPNGQPVDHRGFAYVLRRGAIAAGRVVGLVGERVGDWRKVAS
ncbi:MAG: glycosyltransferase [Acidimicrobiales bacterium]